MSFKLQCRPPVWEPSACTLPSPDRVLPPTSASHLQTSEDVSVGASSVSVWMSWGSVDVLGLVQPKHADVEWPSLWNVDPSYNGVTQGMSAARWTDGDLVTERTPFLEVGLLAPAYQEVNAAAAVDGADRRVASNPAMNPL